MVNSEFAGGLMIREFLSQFNHSSEANLADEAVLRGNNTDSFTPQSIIIRIWIEPRGKDETPDWYGHMTTVGTNERVYVKSLNEMLLFFASFLHQAGARLPLSWQIRLWLRNLRKTRS